MVKIFDQENNSCTLKRLEGRVCVARNGAEVICLDVEEQKAFQTKEI